MALSTLDPQLINNQTFAMLAAEHNLAVNPFQQISQENGDTAGTATGYYPCDEERVSWAGTMTTSVGRVAAPFTSRLDIPRGIKIEVTGVDASVAAGDYLSSIIRIEGEKLRSKLGWGAAWAKPLSIGRVVRMNVAGTISISVHNSAVDRTYVKDVAVLANTDTFVSITTPGDTTGTWLTDTGVGVTVAFTFMAGASLQTSDGAWVAGNFNGTLATMNLCATVGNTAWLGPLVILPGIYLPTFADIMWCQRPFDQVLRSCQRYYQIVAYGLSNGAISAAGQTGAVKMLFPVPMRVTPTRGTPTQNANAGFPATNSNSFDLATHSFGAFKQSSAANANANWYETAAFNARL